MVYLIRLLSLRHMLGAPFRTLLTVMGVAVGVATLVGITSINKTVLESFRSTVDTIAGKAELSVTNSAAGFDDSYLERVKSIPGVRHASGALTAIAPLVGKPGQSLYVQGVDFLDDGYFRSYEGVERALKSLSDDLEFLNSTDRILITDRFAKEHRLKQGDTFSLVTPQGVQPFVVHALIKETGALKAFGGSVGVMFLGSAQVAFSRGRNIDRIDVALDPSLTVEQGQQRLLQTLGSAFEVERPGRRGASVQNMLRSFQMGLNVGSGVALIVGLFLVYNTVSIAVVQRRREIGTLRALGASRTDIQALFTLEAVVLGILGTLIGLPLGFVVSKGAVSAVSETISSLYVQVNATTVEMGIGEMLLGAGMGILGSALSAFRPATKASWVQPVECLRRDVSEGGAHVSWRNPSTLGGAMLCLLAAPVSQMPTPWESIPIGGYAAIFMILLGGSLLAPMGLQRAHRFLVFPSERMLGISGRLAADNFVRSPFRSAVPVAALAVGVAMTVCIAGFVNSFHASSERWLEQSIPAHIFVTSSARLAGIRNSPMNADLREQLIAIDGVQAVDEIRIFPHDVLDLRVFIHSQNAEIYTKHAHPLYVEGRAPTREESSRRFVSISENLMRRRNLHPGSIFSMKTPTGIHEYQVTGVRLDYTSDQGTIFMDRASFVRDFADSKVDTFEIYLKNVDTLETVRREITSKFASDHQLSILSNQELRVEAHSMIEKAFGVTRAMEVVAVLLALLGVVNTLLAAVLDRTREIGLLRAIGAHRFHVLKLFAAEAGLMGISGSVLGVAMGVSSGLVLTHVIGAGATGWTFPYVFPAAVSLQMMLAATLCAVVAGLLPAQKATQLDVVQALSYE